LAPETLDAYVSFIEKSLGHMADMRDCLARHGLAEGRFIVLEQLMNASEPMSHTQLAEQVGVTKGGYPNNGATRGKVAEMPALAGLGEVVRLG